MEGALKSKMEKLVLWESFAFVLRDGVTTQVSGEAIAPEKDNHRLYGEVVAIACDFGKLIQFSKTDEAFLVTDLVHGHTRRFSYKWKLEPDFYPEDSEETLPTYTILKMVSPTLLLGADSESAFPDDMLLNELIYLEELTFTAYSIHHDVIEGCATGDEHHPVRAFITRRHWVEGVAENGVVLWRMPMDKPFLIQDLHQQLWALDGEDALLLRTAEGVFPKVRLIKYPFFPFRQVCTVYTSHRLSYVLDCEEDPVFLTKNVLHIYPFECQVDPMLSLPFPHRVENVRLFHNRIYLQTEEGQWFRWSLVDQVLTEVEIPDNAVVGSTPQHMVYHIDGAPLTHLL